MGGGVAAVVEIEAAIDIRGISKPLDFVEIRANGNPNMTKPTRFSIPYKYSCAASTLHLPQSHISKSNLHFLSSMLSRVKPITKAPKETNKPLYHHIIFYGLKL
jgi:hypothetical protein